ncbi:hypothetical protein EV182_003281, partial [Spiromyces aspiralis]
AQIRCEEGSTTKPNRRRKLIKSQTAANGTPMPDGGIPQRVKLNTRATHYRKT